MNTVFENMMNAGFVKVIHDSYLKKYCINDSYSPNYSQKYFLPGLIS